MHRIGLSTLILLWTFMLGLASHAALAQAAAAPAEVPAVATPAAPAAAAPAAPAVLATPAAPAVEAPAAPAASLDKADTGFMIVASGLVLMMTPALAFFYGGLVRRKNVLSVLMQCFMCMALVTILWVTVGFSLAFGSDVLGGFVGNPKDFFMLRNVSFSAPWEPVAGYKIGIPQQLFMVYQGMFAIITPGLIIGAFAERMKFSAFTLFSAAWLLLVYCPVAHWVWYGPTGTFGLGAFDPKDATSIGALDFAGGTVVHINAGIAALVCTLVLGKRLGYADGKISPPHNLPFAVLGAGLLWFGWFGFNGGSALGANEWAVRAMVVTHVAAAAAGLSWTLIEWIRLGHPTVLGMITGAVAGLVAITPASGFVDVSAAIWIGLGATLVSYIFVAFLKPALGYDDSLDVFGVHGISGIWGAVATGIFAIKGFGQDKAGGLLEGNTIQLWLQIKAVLFTIVWAGVVSYILLKLVDTFVGLRPTNHEERIGLDLSDHAEAAYTLVE